ncbi:MAG: hypothetical protein BWY87_01505 [Deltaproteobacteria bacterium ADurb.Bin510]|nr:MAG: hypothetical protein BWY87_01505 [Deltaproteobacteria bacterium ADurb.Bin510]
MNALRKDVVSTDKDAATWSPGDEPKIRDKRQPHAIAKHSWGIEQHSNDGRRGSLNT